MKEIKTGTVLLIIVVAFAVFCTGIYVGKQSTGDAFIIMTEKQSIQIHTEETEEIVERISTTSATVPPTTTEQWQIASEGTEGDVETALPDTRININTATLAELMQLPGIGEKLAQRIIDYRTSNGPFKKVDDLQSVNGIGEKTMDNLRDLISVGDTE